MQVNPMARVNLADECYRSSMNEYTKKASMELSLYRGEFLNLTEANLALLN